MDDYMDNMANAVTNENTVLEQLVVTNAKQATTIATQTTTIQNLSVEVRQLQLKISTRGGRGGISGKSDDVSKFLKDG